MTNSIRLSTEPLLCVEDMFLWAHTTRCSAPSILDSWDIFLVSVWNRCQPCMRHLGSYRFIEVFQLWLRNSSCWSHSRVHWMNDRSPHSVNVVCWSHSRVHWMNDRSPQSVNVVLRPGGWQALALNALLLHGIIMYEYT